MWKFVILFALVAATTNGSPLPATTEDAPSSSTAAASTTSAAPSTTTLKPAEMPTTTTVAPKETEVKPSSPLDPMETMNPPAGELEPPTASPDEKPPKRKIFYDQRQEGKYNIRADLENFVILVIPSTPSSGASLLDLLSRANVKKNHRKRGGHKKHSVKGDLKGLDYLSAKPEPIARTDEFIEGRTPYRVDISSSDESARLHAEPGRLEMIPRYTQPLRSPVLRILRTLDIEEPVAQVFPVQGNDDGDVVVAMQKRHSKSLFETPVNGGIGGGDVNSNSVLLTPVLGNNDDDDVDEIGSRGFKDISDRDNSFDSLNVDNIDRLYDPNFGQGWELTLLGAEEQCGPDRKRDSYGVCQYVPNYS